MKRGRKKKQRPEFGAPLSECKSLRDVEAATGVSRKFLASALLLRAIPDDEFERLVDSDNPPTLRRVELLARRRTGKKTEYIRRCPHCGQPSESRTFAEVSLKMKAALYMRVSTDEQTTDNQALELRSFAGRAGHQIVAEFLDIESGSKADRQGLNALLDAASRREFDLVLFIRLDRITGLGAARMHAFFERLDGYGVAYKSLYDSWLDSGIPMLRDIMLSVIASFARNERETLIARTKAGLDRCCPQKIRPVM